MNSVYRSGQWSVILAGITSTLMAVIFVFVLLCASAARGADGSIVKALVRPNEAPEPFANGTVLVEKHGNEQSFVVTVRNIPLQQSGLAVFLGDSLGITNSEPLFVSVLSKGNATNDQWTLNLKGDHGAPPFLGVDDVEELVGKFVFVVNESTNVLLRTMITPLQPKLSATSFHARAKLFAPDPAPSPRAVSTVSVKYDAKRGASLIEIRSRKLAAGIGYCIIYSLESPLPPGTLCASLGDNLIEGQAFLRHDTRKGEDLPFGLEAGVTTIADLAGIHVFVVDPFGAQHLMGTIPGPK